MLKMFMKTVVVVMVAFLIGLTVPDSAFAAPEVMPDGNVFDADYYAESNPDVVAVFGNDANILYVHYLNFGKAEGRLPYQMQVGVQTVAPQQSDLQTIQAQQAAALQAQQQAAALQAQQAAALKAQQQAAAVQAQQQAIELPRISINSGDKVYWTEKGKSYHRDPGCRSFRSNSKIYSGTLSSCPKDDPCDWCS